MQGENVTIWINKLQHLKNKYVTMPETISKMEPKF